MSDDQKQQDDNYPDLVAEPTPPPKPLEREKRGRGKRGAKRESHRPGRRKGGR